MRGGLELIELSTRAREFLALEVAEHQRSLVATVAESFADVLFPPEHGLGSVKPWLRGVTRDGVPAGFIMCADPDGGQQVAWILRLLVDKNHQGLGVGTFAMQSALDRYRALGIRRVFLSWQPGPGNAAGFYRRLGFVETGEVAFGEVVAVLEI